MKRFESLGNRQYSCDGNWSTAVVEAVPAIQIIAFPVMGRIDVPKGMPDVSDQINCKPDDHEGLKGCIEAADVDRGTQFVF